MVASKENVIIIHKANSLKNSDTNGDLLKLEDLSGINQMYSGVYDSKAIIKIIGEYKPERIVVYCNDMHASTIVRIIFDLQVRKYRLRMHQVIIYHSRSSTTLRTMILKFWSSLTK